MEERTVKRDRMRYIKNSLAANLAILGILFDVFYFVKIYQSDVGTYYYTILIGVSIVYNLVFLLAVFLASEGVKNYKAGYTWLLAASKASSPSPRSAKGLSAMSSDTVTT